MNQSQYMSSIQNLTEEKFIKFLQAQGILVKTNTKARGNLGICFKNRIDISKNAEKNKRLNILIHEYAHKIHYDMEGQAFNKGGTLKRLFNTENTEILFKELMQVTNFVDENSQFKNFYQKKEEIKREIKNLEQLIKKDYSDFKRTSIFKPINSYLSKNKSPIKYLLKYDNVKVVQPVFKKENFYSIKNIDNDFPEIPEVLRAYIKLKAKEREYKRLYRSKNKAEKYYKKPTELFARFIEGIFINNKMIQAIAPTTYIRFYELLKQGYYGNLKELLILANLDLNINNGEKIFKNF